MTIGTVSKIITLRLLLLVLLISLFMPDISAAAVQTYPHSPLSAADVSLSDHGPETGRRIKRSPKGGAGRGGRGGGSAGGIGRSGGRAVGLGSRHVTPFSGHSARTSFHAILLPFYFIATVIVGFN